MVRSGVWRHQEQLAEARVELLVFEREVLELAELFHEPVDEALERLA